MGELWLGQFAKGMIERDLHHAKRSEAIGFSHGDFGFVIQALDDPAGIRLASAEIIQQQLAMSFMPLCRTAARGRH